jgi:photosystem II stability/assembly factor-like uncharacterized protein
MVEVKVATPRKRPLIRAVGAALFAGLALVGAASATNAYTFPRFQPVSIAFVDELHGVLAEDDWACQKPDGCQGRILVTSDGGSTWRQIYRGARGIELFPVRGTPVIYAIGGSGMIESTDGGLHWRKTAIPAVLSSFVTPLHGWRVGFTLKAVLRRPPPLEETRDGGRTWMPRVNPCPPPDYGQASALSFATATRGWAVCATQATAGYQGKEVWETDNGGMHWQLRSRTHPIGPPEPKLQVGRISGYGYPTGIAFLADGHGWLLQDRGYMLTTLDGGHTWTPSLITKPDTIATTSADLLNDNVGYILLRGCKVKLDRTTNGGKSWTTVHVWNSPTQC